MLLGPAKDGGAVILKVKLDSASLASIMEPTLALTGGRDSRVSSLSAGPAKRQVEDRTFAIEFLGPGVHASAFTFG